tara:strand:+ start:116 stop:304 length:189 start_codon:yes stop_codon:yes gene_type:complete
MRVIKVNSSITGVPDYFDLYERWLQKYTETGDNNSKVLALHYARVAQEMGQAEIDDDITLDI